MSIEAKFLTIRTTDLDKVGFNWNAEYSDQNNRDRQLQDVASQTYNYDINGDGVDETIPIYNRPTAAT